MSFNFRESVEINDEINKLIKKLLHNQYTGNLWDYTTLNALDREKEAQTFVETYIKKNGVDSIEGVQNKNDFIIYVAKQIDRLIPLSFFMEYNTQLSFRYNSLLTRRLFITDGKDGFEITENFEYKYPQDFSSEKAYLEKTNASAKQIQYIKNLAEEQGFLVTNTKYLSMSNAKKIISYLKGEIDQEPLLFNFFIVAI